MTFDQFEVIAQTVGNQPTQDQADRLSAIIVEQLPKAHWEAAALICGGDVYTDISMRLGESGIY